MYQNRLFVELLGTVSKKLTRAVVANLLGYTRVGVYALINEDHLPPLHVRQRLLELTELDQSFFDGVPGHRAHLIFRLHKERDRQIRKFGDRHPDKDLVPDLDLTVTNYVLDAEIEARKANDHGEPAWITILLEEVAEAVRAETSPDRITELVEVATVAITWAEYLMLKEGWEPKDLSHHVRSEPSCDK